MEGDRPKVGIGIIVKRGNKILLGERLSNHGAGTFEIPGGHLEFGETFEEAAKREVLEETGLQDITLCGVVSIGNDILYDKHYVSIGLLAECHSGESYDAEPEHSRNWRWYALDKLPVPVFPHSQRVIDNWLSGKIYTDSNLITSHV
ncbi:MAG: NUDIX domain-containing protein [Candidatus Sungbacteria bacterium]|uniref:NUDIX domain-containing protein n=1 Tax=Candidatus Sungiibacteriota bacterium TaxID=2750080 RepID=A0A9D6LNR6_9BACT|nr:NUDIX domain-containing protein [Candidatus Sungbacteria bacterium]